MEVWVLGEYGYGKALFGIGLSYGLTSGKQFFPDFLTNWMSGMPAKKFQKAAKKSTHYSNG